MIMLPDPEDLIPIIFSSCFCLVLISFRCGYRLVRGCKIHTRCFRTWHRDDTIMAVSLAILAVRATTIAYSRVLADKVSTEGLTEVMPPVADLVLSRKLILPGRIFYALFLWCMKYCLLDLYSRLSIGLPVFERTAFILRIVLGLTYIAIALSTVLECRPIDLYWNGLPAGDQCRLARANYITVGTFDLGTDLALIVFPIPIVWKASMDLKKYALLPPTREMPRLRLAAVFSAGSLVVIVTLVRIPITLKTGIPQSKRSLWADIEIACACLVTNIVSFYYPLARDIMTGHLVTSGSRSGASRSSQAVQWEANRQPSYPDRGSADEEELKLFTVSIREADGKNQASEDSVVQRTSIVRELRTPTTP